MVKMRKDDFLSIIVVCMVLLMTPPVKSGIVRNNEMLKRNNYQLQLNSDEDEYVARKSGSNPVRTIKNKSYTLEPISEQVTSVPVTKDREIISLSDDTFKKNLKAYEILDEGKENLGGVSKRLKESKLKRIRRQDSTASTAGKSKGTTDDAGGSSTVVTRKSTTDEYPPVGTFPSPKTKVTVNLETTKSQTEGTGNSETTISHTGMTQETKAPVSSGFISGGTHQTSHSGSTGATAETAKSESTTSPTSKRTTSGQLMIRYRAAETIDPGTFVKNMEPYTLRNGLISVKNENIEAIDEEKEPDVTVFDKDPWTVSPNRTNLKLNRTTRAVQDKLYQDGSNGEESSKFEDPYVVIKDIRGSNEDSSRIDGRSNERASEEDSSEDRKIPQSDKAALDKDFPYERKKNQYRQSAQDASEEKEPLIIYPDMADKIRKEENGGVEKVRYRQQSAPGIPDRPRHPSILHASRTSIILSWARPKEKKGATKVPLPRGYIVEMKGTKGTYSVEGLTEEPFIRLNELEPGNTYFFKVTAQNEKGNSTPLVIKYIMDDEIPAEDGGTEGPPEAYVVEKGEEGDIVIKEVLF